MANNTIKEVIIYDGSEVYELKHEYLKGSVITSQGEVQEIGSRFISVTNIAIPEGETFEVGYKVEQETRRRFEADRLTAVEKRLDALEKENEELKKALRNRLDVGTFNAWMKALEHQLGVEIIKQSFHTVYPR